MSNHMINVMLMCISSSVFTSRNVNNGPQDFNSQKLELDKRNIML